MMGLVGTAQLEADRIENAMHAQVFEIPCGTIDDPPPGAIQVEMCFQVDVIPGGLGDGCVETEGSSCAAKGQLALYLTID